MAGLFRVYEVKYVNELTSAYERAAIRQYQCSRPSEAISRYKDRYGLNSSNIVSEKYRVETFMSKKVSIAFIKCCDNAVSRVLIITNNAELNDCCVADLMLLHDDLVCETFENWSLCGYDKYVKRKKQILKTIYNGEKSEEAFRQFIEGHQKIEKKDMKLFNWIQYDSDKAFIIIRKENILKYGKQYKWR